MMAAPSFMPLSDAVEWLEHLILGSLGTTVAVLAVGIVGLATLMGRLPVRRSVSVVFGCFILFGAPVIARGLLGAASATVEPIEAMVPPAPSYIPVVPKAMPYDPYAGASVPMREAQPTADLSAR